MISRRAFVATASSTLLFAALARADDSAEAIVKRAVARDGLGLEGGHASLTMTVVQDDGTTEARAFEVWIKKKDGLFRTLVRFKSPAKIAGMAFLLLQRAGMPDEQYVYLPAYKKARRITTKERTSAFASSDLTFFDLERRETKDATYKKLPEENIGKDACNVIEATPVASIGSPYARVITWLRKTDDVPLRTQFFSLDGKLEKTMFTKKLKTVDGKLVISESRLERATGPRATELRVDSVSFVGELPDSTFTLAALESGG